MQYDRIASRCKIAYYIGLMLPAVTTYLGMLCCVSKNILQTHTARLPEVFKKIFLRVRFWPTASDSHKPFFPLILMADGH